jgi:hypothetical protein
MSARQTEPSQYVVQAHVAPAAHEPPAGTRGAQVFAVGEQTSDRFAQDGAGEAGVLSGLHGAPVDAG